MRVCVCGLFAHLVTARVTEQVIQLLPTATSSQQISSVWITTLPSLGTLYQTSINFETFGYKPTRTIQITSAPTQVTSPTYRVVYVPPPNFASTNFSYMVQDLNACTQRSHPLLLTATDKVSVTSQFWTDNEWWTVQTAVNTNATWSATSTGNLNFFIYGGDFDPTLNLNNAVRWFFQAPPKFLGYVGVVTAGEPDGA